MDALLAELVAIKTAVEAESNDRSYHTDHDEISRVIANSEWIGVYVRRAEAERANAADRDAYVVRLRELIDEVSDSVDTAGQVTVTSRIKFLLDHLE